MNNNLSRYCRNANRNRNRHETIYEFPRRTRSGTSLVEMLIVITIAAVMVGLGVTTIHLLLAAEHDVTRSVRYAASTARLARVFRDDVHAASAVELPVAEADGPAVLIATTAEGGQVRYELEANLATRIETDAAGLAHRDVFYFPPHSNLRFERDGEGGLVRIEMELPVAEIGAGGAAPAAIRQPMQRMAIEAAMRGVGGQRSGLPIQATSPKSPTPDP